MKIVESEEWRLHYGDGSTVGAYISRSCQYPTNMRAHRHFIIIMITRQSKHCGFSIYSKSKSKSMVRLVRAMVLYGLVFARKIAKMILIQNI